jgi:hypothetical protein
MIERIGLRWRLVGLLAAVLVIVALPYVVTRSSVEDALNSRDWVTHTADVKASVYRLDAILRSGEAATYALVSGAEDTPEIDERVRYPRETVPGILASLRVMLHDNADQLTRLAAIDAIASGRMALAGQAIERLKAGDRQGALASMQDAQRMFPMRAKVKELLDEGVAAAQPAS